LRGGSGFFDCVAELHGDVKKLVESHKPARLNALTGLRTFAAINIVLFHFSNPLWFGWLAPVVNAGYASVSFFILLSGFVLGYNYNARARAGQLDKLRFYEARFTRLYPGVACAASGVGRSHARYVLDRDCSRTSSAAGVDSGNCNVSKYASMDNVG
jgi:hypothetical protein